MVALRRYLQQNCIWAISHLEGVPELDTLNISHNMVKRLEGLSVCPKLTTLLATDNQLETVDSIAHLVECQSLTTVDLQNNRLTDPDVLDVFKQLPNLKCLYLKGNPVVSNIKNYRKTVVAALPGLGYLDDRPIFEDERRMIDAWCVHTRMAWGPCVCMALAWQPAERTAKLVVLKYYKTSNRWY